MKCGPKRHAHHDAPGAGQNPGGGGFCGRSGGARPNRLYRNTERGRIFGVCAGLADYFGVSVFMVRIAAVIALFMFTAPTLIAYFIATLLIDKAPGYAYESDAEKEFWRQIRLKPSESLSRLRHRYREQEQRIRSMEAFVTSSEAKLHQAFRDLES